MDIKSALVGVGAFVLAVLLTLVGILGYNQYQLTQGLRAVVTGQCSQVEEAVINQAVEKALANGDKP